MNFRTDIVDAFKRNFSFDKIPCDVFSNAIADNSWFTEQDIKFAFCAISDNLLDIDNINRWLSNYSFKDISCKNVGVIMAGNIPLVGFADLLVGVVANANIYVKLSSKDSALMGWVVDIFNMCGANIKRLYEDTSLDALIATGSNNSNRYFETLYPSASKLLRGSRVSVAIVDSSCSCDDIDDLWSDCFQFYGLGCRNISHIFVEDGCDIARIVEKWRSHAPITHSDYLGSYRQKRAIFEMLGEEFYDGGYFLLQNSQSLFNPLGLITYSNFKNREELDIIINSNSSDIQCVVGGDYLLYGEAQKPMIWDYADGVDTLKFLLDL